MKFPFTLAGKNAYAFILDMLLPFQCVLCARQGALLCAACARHLGIIPPSCMVCKKITSPAEKQPILGRTCMGCRKQTPIRVFFSPCRYAHTIPQLLVHALKFKGVWRTKTLLAKIIMHSLSYYGVFLPANAVCIPIPLTSTRRRERGFNQAELLATELAQMLHLSSDTALLTRIRDHAPQTSMNADERHENIKGVFAATPGKITSRQTYILIDDVKTTGATLTEAALCLKKAGAKRIWAITFAH